LLNGKGKKGDASLLRKLWMAIKGVKTIKKWIIYIIDLQTRYKSYYFSYILK
jgi:hypothetical protein